MLLLINPGPLKGTYSAQQSVQETNRGLLPCQLGQAAEYNNIQSDYLSLLHCCSTVIA
jgi:hypothetical protein